MQQSEISILSWNVWFGLRNRSQRMTAMGKVIQQFDPDFIFLQEVTADIMKEIVRQKWTHAYYISDPEAKLVNKYGNVMFSKFMFHECINKDFPSIMGRQLMIGTVVVQDSPQLLFGTFHLESDARSISERAKQLSEFVDATNSGHYVFLVGDTNFVNDSESSTLCPKFTDIWSTLHPDKEGFTFDTVQNPMAREEYLGMGITEDRRQRLDRLFYTHETIQPISIELLGQKPYWKNEFISDHFGIFVRLNLKK
eukprot:TRINITY_DN3385_c0_g1_i1.p1 TRINITY_DN3385_c0_g1~~TRINITY_DN3385_c0_g1_i1.p1  ORF type:complete len:253 (-),score=37.65 TRINITY_DN3385_c0_g1_i1:141-899(-)